MLGVKLLSFAGVALSSPLLARQNCPSTATLPDFWRPFEVETPSPAIWPIGEVPDESIQLKYRRENGLWCVYEVVGGFGSQPAEAITPKDMGLVWNDDWAAQSAAMLHLGKHIQEGQVNGVPWMVIRAVDASAGFGQFYETTRFQAAYNVWDQHREGFSSGCQLAVLELASAAVKELKRNAEAYGLTYKLDGAEAIWENILFDRAGTQVFLNDVDLGHWRIWPAGTPVDEQTLVEWKRSLLDQDVRIGGHNSYSGSLRHLCGDPTTLDD